MTITCTTESLKALKRARTEERKARKRALTEARAKKNKNVEVFVVQEFGYYGWEDACNSIHHSEANDDLKAYRANGGGSYRLIKRIVKRENYEKGDF